MTPIPKETLNGLQTRLYFSKYHKRGATAVNKDELEQLLLAARQLEVAVEALEKMKSCGATGIYVDASEVLEQLEQMK